MISIALVLFKGVESIYPEIRDVIDAGIRYFYNDYKMEEIPFALPPEFINEKRNQVDAEKVMDFLMKYDSLQGKDLVISFLERDMYFRDMNFIFGLAHIKGKRIIMSTYRLTRNPLLNPVDSSIYRERVFKEILHEIGHLFQLNHCPDKSCVMNFSSSIVEVDGKLPMFCGSCREKIRARM
jgi:archaemetzincin